MSFFDKIINTVPILGKITNSSTQGVSGREFLQHGNRTYSLDNSKVIMSDIEFYTGYSYAALNNRANKVAQLASKYIKTTASEQIMDKARKSNETITHPYLTLIDESDDFTNTQFWYDISTYIDLEGVYFLLAVRNVTPTLVGDVQRFIMINPYNVRRVRNKETMEIGGYVETVDGMTRLIKKENIIEIRKLNPFSNDTPFAMTDAAKESQFTIKQASDFARSSLKNNLSAPGIITTDVLMEPEIFANFTSRILNSEKGLPLFGNGTGSINFDAMQIDMDKAALPAINEINKKTLFAVAGVSSTTMGQEESGTTRDVSKTQKEKFIEDHIMPQTQLIIDALNQDYKKYYKKEYKLNKYNIELDNPLSVDKDAEIKDITIADSSYTLYTTLVSDGYDREIASKYSSGEITLEELGDPTNEPAPTPQETKEAPIDDEQSNNTLKDVNGGPGSGNFGHGGRPGKVGGSSKSGGSSSSISDFGKSSIEEADSYISKNYANDVKSYNENETRAVQSYTGYDGSFAMNDWLRRGIVGKDGTLPSFENKGDFQPKLKSEFSYNNLVKNRTDFDIKHMDTVTKAHSLKEGLTLYRGAISKEKLSKGMIIEDKAFVSTSIRSEGASQYLKSWDGKKIRNSYLMKIVAPKGTKGAFVGDNAKGGRSQSEFIMPRNTKFEIQNITKSSDGYNIVEVTINE